jgi:hypothetical protein
MDRIASTVSWVENAVRWIIVRVGLLEESEELMVCIEGLLDAECLPGPIVCP